jgi:hypothetical protein
MAKKAETRLKDLANHYEWWSRKFGDVSYCKYCGMPLPKSEKAPDYFVSQIGTWIECKNNDSTGTWRCAEIMEGGERHLQREFLNEYGGWLFIELADGRAPKKAAAYLVPWQDWKSFVEPLLIAEDMKSIRRETTCNKDGSIRRIGADELLKIWELKWLQNTGWVIPVNHIFWKDLKKNLKETLSYIENMQEGDGEWQPNLI